MPKTLNSIRKKMDEQIGSKVMLTAQTGRKRQTEQYGILSETYPAVFIVDLDTEDSNYDRVSYSYADILTETIAIEFL